MLAGLIIFKHNVNFIITSIINLKRSLATKAHIRGT